MLFNSHVFIGAFLPTVLVGYLLLAGFASHRVAQIWLTLASLFFYGWWNAAHVPVLIGSIVVNFVIGRMLADRHRHDTGGIRPLLAAGIGANLLLLGYFKYSAFFLNNVGSMAGVDFAVQAVILPLAISFFTFQQIAYLVDASNGQAGEYDFVDYTLFVCFFPQLIAGPIVHHREMMTQFEKPAGTRIDSAAFATGITFFAIGLFKKVVIADSMAVYADRAFLASGEGMALTAIEAWHGVAAYTLQLYFDFSGYSDMAIGLARLFGIRLPYNFNSPYKAASISDFWRRWHMTLSRFLRDYLYIALGGNRHGSVRRYANLIITMTLGGLWHGAGWTFVIWGLLHGLYLSINHGWIALRARLGLTRSFGALGIWAGTVTTLLCVMVGWVFFRAADVDAAVAMLEAMAGVNGWIAPNDPLAGVFVPLPDSGLAFEVARRAFRIDGYLSVALLVIVVWAFPNSQEIVDGVGSKARALDIRWKPTMAWAAGISACFLFTLSQLSKVSAFLYFQF